MIYLGDFYVKKKFGNISALILAITFVLTGFLPQKVFATQNDSVTNEPKVVFNSFPINTSQYDVTGDGKADTLNITYFEKTEHQYVGLKVYVNGKQL